LVTRVDIRAELRDEIGDRLEALLPAHARDNGHRDARVVDVVVEVDEMRFTEADAFGIERRSPTDRDRGIDDASVVEAHRRGVDAVLDVRVVEVEAKVRGGEADRAAALIAVLDDADDGDELGRLTEACERWLRSYAGPRRAHADLQ
jgi:hypothetical protein